MSHCDFICNKQTVHVQLISHILVHAQNCKHSHRMHIGNTSLAVAARFSSILLSAENYIKISSDLYIHSVYLTRDVLLIINQTQ